MGHDLRAQGADGGGGQVVRVHAHAAGEDQQVRPLLQQRPRLSGEHVQVVVGKLHAHDLAGIFSQLPPRHGLEFVLNAPGVDLAAGDDDARLFRPVGQQIQQLFAFAEGFQLRDLRLLRHQRDDAHARQPRPRRHGVVVRQGGDGDVPDAV